MHISGFLCTSQYIISKWCVTLYYYILLLLLYIILLFIILPLYMSYYTLDLCCLCISSDDISTTHLFQ